MQQGGNTMTYDEFRAELKRGLPEKLYLFCGAEDFLKDFSLRAAKDALTDSATELLNYKCYSALPTVGEATDFSEALPVMADRKLLVFRKCGLFEAQCAEKAKWAEFFGALPMFNCVIVWEDDPPKGKKATSPVRAAAEGSGVRVEFPLQTETKLKSWMANVCAASGKTIDAKNASYLIASVGREMGVLHSELAKITAFAADTAITRADIDAVLISPVQDSVFRLIDALFAGKRALCYQALGDLRYNRNEPVVILSTLAGQTLRIYRAKVALQNGLTPAGAAKELGGGYGAQTCVQKAQSAKTENLELLIDLCRRSDQRIKQGLLEPWAALDLIIAEYRMY